ncbi:HNH endonuclease signature motif containing protein [Aeromicrobium sp. 50.2.37]|uniref:HNH endonuclease signature motif containing protein n=1 Tax=Aeromicrobium sp. 50.2.37 TaxID=2969305 RepID=UPI00214F7A6D|nr:HNH endonuclease signature motif containing protein [Aeromicrobium sp. 50.2.37]MCR4512973.1 HNH endonuclease [Aeromicrobium sp. 50.2.37]
MSVAALDTHPVPSCVHGIHALLDTVPTAAWDGLDPAEVRRLLAEIGRAEARLSAHKMAAARVLEKARKAAANGDGPRPGTGTSTGATISIDFGGDRSGADALVSTAERIEAQTTLIENALAAGVISSKQADLISRVLAKLPDDVTPEQRERCEETLLKDAQRLTLKDLRLRGARITEAYKKTTHDVDADEDEILRRREEEARKKTSFSMWDNNDGTVTGRFTLPEAQGAMLKTALDALAAPHQKVGTVNAATGEHDEVGFGQSYPQRLGHAFATLVEHLPADQLPTNGGVSAVVTVNLDLDTLMGGLKAAGLSDGTRISASEARRLACTAKIAPFVLDGKSLPLDFGTSNRYFDAASRRALEKRDMGCTAPGCDRDARWCEAHHMHPYSITGRTDIRDGALLCSFHHHRAHDQDWSGRIADDGHVEWKLPGSDTWRRNTRWRP